jgi:hypothetical protein
VKRRYSNIQIVLSMDTSEEEGKAIITGKRTISNLQEETQHQCLSSFGRKSSS